MTSICIFGDSIVWGAYDPEKSGWVNRLRRFLEEKDDDIEIYNLGISGDNSRELLKRFDIECEAREANLILIAIGINDSYYINSKQNPNVSLDEFEKNLNILLKKSLRFTKKVVFIGLTNVDESKTMPIPWSPTKCYTQENVKKYNLSIEKFCNKNKILFLNLIDLLSFQDYTDGLHPNSSGHEKIYIKVKEFLEDNKLT